MTLSAFSASLRRHAWLAGLGLLALVATHRLIAYDVWWQLAAGRWILDHGLPTHDPFSYAFPGRPWIELRWLYCVVLELIYRVAGVHGLIVAKLLAVLAAAWLWLRAAGATTSAAARGLGALVLLLAVHDRLTIRPELATFVLLGLTVWLLRSGEAAGDRRSGWLVPIQILWCNLHTLAILGPIVQTLHVVTTRREGRWDRRGLVIAVLSWLALLATPYGFRGAAFPFQLWSQIRSGHYLDRVIGEFHGPLSELWFRADPRTIGFLLCVGVSAASFALVPWRRSLFRIGLWVVFLYLGLQAVRNVALFGWVAGFVTVANVAAWEATASEGRRRRVDRVVTTVCWLALLIGAPLIVSGEWARRNHSDKQFGVGISDRRFPIEAWSFIEQAKLPRPIVHGLGDGGYLAHIGGSGEVLVDGRLEVYGESVLSSILPMIETGAGLDPFASRHGIGTVLVRDPVDRPGLFQALEKSPDWVAVYVDPRHVVFVRMGSVPTSTLERYRIDWQRPETWNPGFRPPKRPRVWPVEGGEERFTSERMGLLLTSVGNYEDGAHHIAAALAAGSRNLRVQWFDALYRAADSSDEPVIDRLIHSDPDLARLGGEIFLRRDRPRVALAFFDAAFDVQLGGTLYLERAAVAALAAGDVDACRGRLELWRRMEPHSLRLRRMEEALQRFGGAGMATDPDDPHPSI